MAISFNLTEMIPMLVLSLLNCFSWGRKGGNLMVCGSRPLQLVKQYQYPVAVGLTVPLRRSKLRAQQRTVLEMQLYCSSQSRSENCWE